MTVVFFRVVVALRGVPLHLRAYGGLEVRGLGLNWVSEFLKYFPTRGAVRCKPASFQKPHSSLGPLGSRAQEVPLKKQGSSHILFLEHLTP